MFKSILGTFGSKFTIAVLNFFILILTAKILGAIGRGEITLIITAIAFIVMFNDIVGGAALVYLIPRYDFLKLLMPSWIWALAINGISYFIMGFAHRIPGFNHAIPEEYRIHIFFISLLNCLVSINHTILVAKENIKQNNFLSLLRIIIHVATIVFLWVVLKRTDIQYYILSLYIAYGFGLLTSSLAIKKYFEKFRFSIDYNVLKKMFSYGFTAQSSNVIQFLNYRWGYYILLFYTTKATLGIYSVGISISEAIWLIGGSIAMVQYSKIANTQDILYSRKLTLQLAKLSLFATTGAVVILLLFPSSFFVWMFGAEFEYIRKLIFILSAGIIAIGFTITFSHYFSGIGKYAINTYAAIIGFILTVALNYTLVPIYGLAGAALATSLSYIGSSIFLTIVFLRETQLKLKDFLFTSNDFDFFMKSLKQLYVRNSGNN